MAAWFAEHLVMPVMSLLNAKVAAALSHQVAALQGMDKPASARAGTARSNIAGNRSTRTVSMKVARDACAALLILILAAIVVATGVVAASARDDGQWANVPENVRQWFRSLKQPDHPRQSCCGEADAFEADNFEAEGDHYVAIITNGKGVIPSGTRIPVPNQKMKSDAGNPTGHGIIFLGPQRQVYCYVTPGGL
jgi:hypothetical protein